jgi:NAD(P)H dehydrogenase (quinone)
LLAQAFAGATGVFLMNPPNYDSERGFPDIERAAKATAEAIARAKPGKIVLLSTIGAHVQEFNLLNRSTLFERILANAGVVAFLRAAWFMENAVWDLASARSVESRATCSRSDARSTWSAPGISVARRPSCCARNSPA